MTTTDQYQYVGRHAGLLGNGRPVAPGEVVDNVDMKDPHNKAMKKAKLLLPFDPDWDEKHQLAGEELTKRAQQLDIPNRASVNADELRQAVQDVESGQGKEGNS